MPKYLGGVYAPPLPKERLVEYKKYIETSFPGHLKEAFLGFVKMLEVFYETPESKKPVKPDRLGLKTDIDLEDAEIKRIWDYVPYPHELVGLRAEIRNLSESSEDLDNAKRNEEAKAKGLPGLRPHSSWNLTVKYVGGHLLWFASRLSKDKQPYTNDKFGH